MPMMLLMVAASSTKRARSQACQEFKKKFPEEIPTPVSCRPIEPKKFLVTVI